MPASSTGAKSRLPTSHYFVTLARGRSIRTVTIRAGVAQGLVALVTLLACWTVGSSLYLAFHDDLVASLMARQAMAQYAYEDRIAALRGQVEREASRELVGRSSIESQVRELALRAATLETRASLVAQMADRTGFVTPHDKITAADPSPDLSFGGHAHERAAITARGDITGSVTAPTEPVTSVRHVALPGAEEKPRPEADAGPLLGGDPRQSADASSIRLKLATVTETLEQVDGSQYQVVASIDEAARRKSNALRAIIIGAGLSPERLKIAPAAAPMGGPFVPLGAAFADSPFGHAIASLETDVAAAEHLRRAMPRVPFASPLLGAMEVTSPFGARLDPFLGKAAMHPGVDLREEAGTQVRATAAGRVVTAGPLGGYGNMIELDHGNGLSTRYAHLETILVSDGQAVEKGAVIGRVGSTGRSTGPHLHYETRIDGEAVDPMRFLTAGQRLAALGPAL